jgi:RNA polymerase subunit RPABC4/transcription elongation factor Spt4
MDRRIFHGNIEPNDIAQALLADFNRGNMYAQVFGRSKNMAVQISTRMGAQSGGQTALTVTIQATDDGIMIEIGQQAWLGVAASLGQTAISALRNPFSLLGRLDDLAQDIENIQLNDNIWKIIDQTIASVGASHELSDRLKREICEYCQTANPVGTASCIACGAPLGNVQPVSCPNCGFAVSQAETICPNCSKKL